MTQSELNQFGTDETSSDVKRTSDNVVTEDEFGEAQIRFTVGGTTYIGTIEEGDNESMTVVADGQSFNIVNGKSTVYVDRGAFQQTVEFLEFLDTKTTGSVGELQ